MTTCLHTHLLVELLVPLLLVLLRGDAVGKPKSVRPHQCQRTHLRTYLVELTLLEGCGVVMGDVWR